MIPVPAPVVVLPRFKRASLLVSVAIPTIPSQTETIHYGTSPSQYLLFTPASSASTSAPLAIVLHGGFWKSCYGLRPPTAAIETVAPDLTRRGFAVAEVEYRRDEDTPWGWPHTNNDVAAAFAAAVALPGVDEERVFLIGHSAGGTLALWLVAQRVRLRLAVVPARTYALAPVADLRRAAEMGLSDRGDAVQRYMHGVPSEMPAAYAQACPMDFARELAMTGVTLAVGRNDRDVPEEIVRRLFRNVTDTVQELGCNNLLEYQVFEGVDHYQIVSANELAWQWVANDLETRAFALLTQPVDKRCTIPVLR